jgi:hypothetical protein
MTRLLFPVLLVVASMARADGADEVRPKPEDVKEFVADPIPAGPDFFKEFKVTQKDLEAVLKDYVQVAEERWKNGYSHVAFGDRTGHMILKDGRKIKWMVKPGNLAWLEFPSGKKTFLAGSK